MIDAYPLSWPAGWSRSKFRKAAQFTTYKRRLDVSDGANRVFGELEKLKVKLPDVVISTNIKPGLGSRSLTRADQVTDPGAAVYWNDKQGRPRVMAIDIYDRVADNLAAIAATLEALRAIERHGGAEILERAFTGFTALPAPDHQRTWREVLGVASLPGNKAEARESVETAYRRLRSLHHPDKGGDAAAFSAVQAAYDQAITELGP